MGEWYFRANDAFANCKAIAEAAFSLTYVYE